MKKIRFIIFLLLICFTLIGCDNDNTTVDTTMTTEEVTTIEQTTEEVTSTTQTTTQATSQTTTETTVMHTVTFYDWDGSVLSTVQVEDGGDLVNIASPERTGYTFIGWDHDLSEITASLTITAQYEINRYTVTFLDKYGDVLKIEEVDYFTSATAPDAPVIIEHVFIGWDVPFNEVTEDLTVSATYQINQYTVTFNTDGGEPIASITADFGVIITLPTPSKVDSIFDKWILNGSDYTDKLRVLEDVTITAVWIDVLLDNFLYEVVDGYIRILHYTSSHSEVIIPDFYQGMEVREIGENAFSNNNSLTKITIGKNVAIIGDNAFNSCANLKTVVLAADSKLTTIGDMAFTYAIALEEFYIPNTVTYVGNGAFGMIAAPLLYLESGTDMTGWNTSWNVLGPNFVYIKEFSYTEDFLYIVNENDTISIINLNRGSSNTDLIIPSYIDSYPVVSIERSAFAGTNYSSVYIPSTILNIEDSAFSNCENLETVVFEENNILTEIGARAFSGCIKLLNINLESCTSLETIGMYAFENTVLKYLFIPESVINMGEDIVTLSTQTFIYCEVASKPVGWSDIWARYSPSIFYDVDYIDFNELFEYVVFNDNTVSVLGFADGAFESNLVIPDTIDGKYVVLIHKNAFSNEDIETLYIGKYVKAISFSAFKNCDSLVSVTFDEYSKLEIIDSYAFANCTSLKFINLSACEVLTTLNFGSFINTGFITVFIPISIVEMESGIFSSPVGMKIYCEATEKPEGWDPLWNHMNHPVVWGYVPS